MVLEEYGKATKEYIHHLVE